MYKWNEVNDIHFPGMMDTCLAVWYNAAHNVREVCETRYSMASGWKAMGRRLHESDEWQVTHWMFKPEPPNKRNEADL